MAGTSILTRVLGLTIIAVALSQLYRGHWFAAQLGRPASSSRSLQDVAYPALQDGHTTMSSFLETMELGVFRLGTQGPWTQENFYKGLPVSAFRPTGQFYVQSPVLAGGSSSTTSSESRVPPISAGDNESSSNSVAQPSPLMTIVTATRNPRELFFTRTVRFVLEQSLQSFRWVIVNDHSTDPESLRHMQELKAWAQHHEPHRFLLVDNSSKHRHGNGPSAMNYGLQFVGDSPFVAILDDDDLWELTTLEKAALVMAWVPDAHAVSFDVVNHGDKEFMWKRGFYNGDESFFTENNMMQGSPFRSSVLRHCRFREDMADGGADWDFWMCMASHGMWGLHVPENGNWYQWNPPDFRKRRWKAVTSHKGLKVTLQRIQQRYPSLLDEDAWPAMVLPPRDDWMPKSTGIGADPLAARHAPFANPVGLRAALTQPHRGGGNADALDNHTSSAVLLALRDLVSNRTTSENAVRFTREFAKAGWRVTVLLTHYSDDEDEVSQGLKQQLLRYTHDVFMAGIVAPLDKLPDLVAYLIESRGISLAVVLPDPSPSQITRHLVSAAGAAMRLAGLASHVAPDRVHPIAVIDAGAMDDRLPCGNAALSTDESNSYAISSNRRDAVWFAGIASTAADAHAASPTTESCFLRHGYAAVVGLPRPDGARESLVPRAFTPTIVEAAAEAIAAVVGLMVPDAGERGSRRPLREDERWSVFVQRLILSPSGPRRRHERGMNMREVQAALQYRKKRAGFGRKLQIACPERVYSNAQWIDALEKPKSCDQANGPAFNLIALRASALQQCGAWCIANLGVHKHDAGETQPPAVLGWEFTGACFRAILSVDASPKCGVAIKHAFDGASARPRI